MGDKGGRTDMDRVGLFQEMGYVTINDKYKERGGKQSDTIWMGFISKWKKCGLYKVHSIL